MHPVSRIRRGGGCVSPLESSPTLPRLTPAWNCLANHLPQQIWRCRSRLEGQVRPALLGHRYLPQHSTLLLLAADALGSRFHHSLNHQAFLDFQLELYAKVVLSLWYVPCHTIHPLSNQKLTIPHVGLLYYSAVSLGIFISPIPGTLLLAFRPEYFKYYNLAFAIPSIVYGAVVFRFWAKAKYGFNVQHIMIVQSYAYLTAIKDRLFGIELLWAASGDKKAHKSNKYRNMRVLCTLWTILNVGGMITAVVYRVGFKGLHWYHTLPLIILSTYNLYISHYFIFASWKW